MHAPAALCLIMLALVPSQALASAVKGHSVQQRVEQAPVKSAPVAQQQLGGAAERQPKAAAPAQPILESSKKVYNDESIRRSAAQQGGALSEPSAKSAAVSFAQPQQPAVVAGEPQVAKAPASEPAVVPVAPLAAAGPVAAAAVKPVEPVVAETKPASEQAVVAVEAKSAAAPSPAEAPLAKPEEAKQAVAAEKKDELPAQSVRSVPIKDDDQAPSRVIVEQAVPAKPAVAQEAAPQVAQVVAGEQPAFESALQAKKEDESSVAQSAKSKEAEAPIEVPAPDPGLVLSEPIDSTTKLLIDLDEHVQKFLPAEDKQEPAAPAKDQVLVSGVDYSPAAQAANSPPVVEQPSGKSNAPALVPYSDTEPIVPPLPQAIDKVEKAAGAVASPSSQAQQQAANTRQASGSSSHQHQNQQQVITQLLDQLDTLQNRIQDTINQLVARRRYVMSALLRPMGTYVRRVRTNLERLQNRVNQLQAAAVSVGGNQNGQRPGGFVDAAAIETIRRRIDDISKRISDIVNRIRFSLTPTSAPLNNNGK